VLAREVVRGEVPGFLPKPVFSNVPIDENNYILFYENHQNKTELQGGN